jgi:hypothetical protein
MQLYSSIPHLWNSFFENLTNRFLNLESPIAVLNQEYRAVRAKSIPDFSPDIFTLNEYIWYSSGRCFMYIQYLNISNSSSRPGQAVSGPSGKAAWAVFHNTNLEILYGWVISLAFGLNW